MKRLKRWFTNLRMQRKFLYCTLGIAIFVLLASSISLYLAASRMVTEQTEKQFTGVINELSVNLDHYFELVENSFDYIANNNVVQEELKSDTPYYSDGEQYNSYYSRAGQIRRLLLQGYTSIYMNDIQLYGYNGANHILSNGNPAAVSEEEAVVKKAEDANGRVVYYNASDGTGLIYVAKQIKDSLTMEKLGILRATIKISYLEKLTEPVQNSLTTEVFLLDDSDGTILTTMNYNPQKLISKFTKTSGSFVKKIDNQTYNCVYQKSADTGFILVGALPMSFLRKTAGELKDTVIILLILCVVLCVILAAILGRGIAGPIEKTSNAMKRFAEGDFTVRLPEGRTDEIGDMNLVFNHTIEEVETLLKKIVDMEIANKDIEFQALQAQINPHFLYNVLDTINWMARKKGEENICHMVTAISNLMRASISNKKSIVTLEDELKYVQDYIYIQETRYGDKFTSYLEIDDSLKQISIPKMTIQTLVENAVVHGIENATWDCFLLVTGEVKEDMAVITIQDNGVGISPEKLQELTREEQTEENNQMPAQVKSETGRTHTHLGAYAVRKRLEYLYDGKADIKFQSKDGKGTTVVLQIPLANIRRSVIDGRTTGNDIR